MSTEIIVAALAAITTAGGVLTAALAKLWTWVDKRVADCEEDRGVLHGQLAVMNTEMRTISRQVGHMEGQLENIKSRNAAIDEAKQ